MPEITKKATLGLGGNIGDVVKTMISAIDLLQELDGVDVENISPLYKTPPWGITSQNWFVNACVEISTTRAPLELLKQCQAIEIRLHRKRTIRWGPRTIDIDILTYEGFTSNDAVLTVPHPRMLERAFVLVPLADIAPEMLIKGMPVFDWLGKVDRSGIEPAGGVMPWWPTD